ncbi:transposase [Ponticoccus gilvus]|nr:transposase [Enemella evansiae]
MKSGRISANRRATEWLESERSRKTLSPSCVRSRCCTVRACRWRQIGISQHTFYRWRKQYGGVNRAQLSRLRELEKETLTLEKLILTEAAQGNF